MPCMPASLQRTLPPQQLAAFAQPACSRSSGQRKVLINTPALSRGRDLCGMLHSRPSARLPATCVCAGCSTLMCLSSSRAGPWTTQSSCSGSRPSGTRPQVRACTMGYCCACPLAAQCMVLIVMARPPHQHQLDSSTFVDCTTVILTQLTANNAARN